MSKSPIRNIFKSLAVLEDLALGTGTVAQPRGVGHQIDIPVGVQSVSELSNLDTTKFTFARLVEDTIVSEYRYINGVWVQVSQEHNKLANRNSAGAHDDIYSRNFKSVTDLRAQTDASGNVISLAALAGNKVHWRGYYTESDGGSNWGIVKVGDSTVLTDDGSSIFIIANDTVNGVWVEANLKGKSLNVKKFGAKGDGVTDDSVPILSCLAYARNRRRLVYFPLSTGSYRHSATLYFGVSDLKIKGETTGVILEYTGVGTGLIINPSYSDPQRERCAFENISLASSTGAVGFDFTGGSYGSYKGFSVNYTAPNAVNIYGRGSNGAGPYFNVFDDFMIIGGVDRSQRGFKFESDTSGNFADGPNANIISNCKRAASLYRAVDIISGGGNMIRNFCGESIKDALIVLNDVPSNAELGTATSSTTNTLTDTSKTWSTTVGDPLNFTNNAVVLTSGPYAGQARRIVSNTVDTLNLDQNWPGDVGTPTYEIRRDKAVGNMFAGIRQEGLASDNPDGIRVMPGARANDVYQMDIGSLGTGKLLDDQYGDTTNKVHQGELVTKTFVLADVGPSKNIDVVPRLSVFGGIREGSNMVLEYIKLESPNFGTGLSAEATLTVDHGGSVTGGGSKASLVCKVNDYNTKVAFITNNNKVLAASRNEAIFVNLQTNSNVDATSDFIVTVAYRVC